MSIRAPLISSSSDSEEETSITYSIPGLNYPSTHFKITHRKFSSLSRDGECPHCNESEFEARHSPDLRTWSQCGGACVLGCWFGIWLIPLLWNRLQVKDYYCKTCKERVELITELV